VLTSSEYFSGRLDWHDFDLNTGASLHAIDETSHAEVVRTTIPAPVSYRGMPAARFWEFEDARVDFGAVDDAGDPPAAGTVAYRLASTTPHNWVPLLPVQSATGLRLARGTVLKADGTRQFVQAQGRLLNPDGSGAMGLAMYEEEIPREGVRVTRTYQLARWQDGGTHLWIGRRKRIGRGEGSSGLRFDRVG
jgi:hypothetical protein